MVLKTRLNMPYEKLFKITCLCFVLTLFPACDTESQVSNLQLKNIQERKEATMKYIESFAIRHCEKITLRYYKKMSDLRDGVAPKTKVINDKSTIEKILLLVNKLPDKGEIMMKLGDVPMLQVILNTDKTENVFFSFYNQSIKTPDTSFYSNHPPAEKILFELFKSELQF